MHSAETGRFPVQIRERGSIRIGLNRGNEKMKPEKISIIGGNGKMGQLFKRVFEQDGYDVMTTGLDTKITNIEAAQKGDVVIVSVPIRETINVIKEIGPHVRIESLLTDFTSVKIEPVKAMLRYSKAEVIGGHPLFGPTVALENQNYVLCPARGKNYLEWFQSFLEEKKVNVVVTTAKDHDERMGIIQCLTHLSNIAMADTLESLKIDVGKTLEFASPIYQIRMGMIGRILNQDPGLYADIQIFNPYSRKILKQYLKSIKKLSEPIKSKDVAVFEKYFRVISEYLGDFCNRAQEESDYLIKKMAERKK